MKMTLAGDSPNTGISGTVEPTGGGGDTELCSVQIGPNNTIEKVYGRVDIPTARWWEILLARVFGKRVFIEGFDDDFGCTSTWYMLRGKVLLARIDYED